MLKPGQACPECSFQLWHPVASLRVSQLGVYDDARFPGRSILMLNEHYDQLDEVPGVLAAQFMADIQQVSAALKRVAVCKRVNMAVLGNAVAHVHAHLIPRYPQAEQHPNSSPWNDQRPKTTLDPAELERITAKIRTVLS